MTTAGKKLENIGKEVLKDLEKGENPYLNIPIRSLSNVEYDRDKKMLKLKEDKSGKRFLVHTGTSKKFMQTMLVSASCKDLIDQGLHTSLRDLFYNLKRTISNPPVIAKITIYDANYEVTVDSELALSFATQRDKIVDPILKKVLKSDKIFKDLEKGEAASAEMLQKEFGTTNVLRVAEQIICRAKIPEPKDATPVIARLLSDGKNFEVLVDPKLALSFATQRDKIVDPILKKVLKSDKIFKDLEKGEAASAEMLQKEFGTTNVLRVAEQIICRAKIPKLKVENTFDEQIESDPIVVDLEVALDILREQLNLSADVRGRVVGNVTIRDRGDLINLAKLGSGGWAIPSNVENIEFTNVDAKFVLVVEKNAAFERLNEDKFWQIHKCIILTTQGQATRGARRLIQRLATEKNLPVYVFTDADPYGWYIYFVIKYGSISLAHVSDRLGTPNAKFLGLTISDIYKKYKDKEGKEDDLQKYTIKAKDIDIKRAEEMQNYEWIKESSAWKDELALMIKEKKKAELEALSGRGFKFMTETYLPEKIKKKDFLD